MCIHKGIVLKEFMDGETAVATKVEFDAALGQNDFKLPDFPMVDKRGKKITLKQSDIEKQNKADNDVKSKEGASTAMEAGLMAAQKAGFKGDKLFGSKVKMTKAQERAAGIAMSNFAYPKKKKKILKEEKAMRFAKECLSKARDKSQASDCVLQIEEMGGYVEFNFKWNEDIKKEALASVDDFLNVRVPCAKSSTTGDAYIKCREENK